MPYALLNSGKTEIQEYPISRTKLAKIFNVMVSSATDITQIVEPGRIVPVQETAKPAESESYTVTEGQPVKQGANWVQVWNTTPLPDQDKTERLNFLKMQKFKRVLEKGKALRSGTFQFGQGNFSLSGDGFARLVMMAAVPGARTIPVGPDSNGLERYFDATEQQVAGLVSAVSGYIDAVSAKESALRTAIKNAATLADLNAIDIDSGWPSNSGQ